MMEAEITEQLEAFYWMTQSHSRPQQSSHLTDNYLLPCDELNIKFRKMYWLLGHNYELSIHNKIILYTQVIHPFWSYGIQLLGCASESNIEMIQRYQNKVLKCIVNAPWYVQNNDLHRDLGIETVTDIITKLANSHKERLHNHINIEASGLLNVNNITRRLKRKKLFELVRC
jgi:hypothetical protein